MKTKTVTLATVIARTYQSGLCDSAGLHRRVQEMWEEPVTLAEVKAVKEKLAREQVNRLKGREVKLHGMWGIGCSVTVTGPLVYRCKTGTGGAMYEVKDVKFTLKDVDYVALPRTRDEGDIPYIELKVRPVCKGAECKHRK